MWKMDRSDLTLAHLPVKKVFHNIGAFEKVHNRNLKNALDEISEKYLHELRVVPITGFYAKIVSGVMGTDLFSGVEIKEITEGLVSPKQGVFCRIAFASIYQSTGQLGILGNPFVEILSEAAAKLPSEWCEYLKWRRRQHWKPVAEWLVKLRAEERNAKRRRPRL